MEHERMVRAFVWNELTKNKNIASLGDGQNLIDLGIIDSLGIMKLLLFLQETFSIRVADEELMPQNFETIEAIVALVEKKMTSAGAR